MKTFRRILLFICTLVIFVAGVIPSAQALVPSYTKWPVFSEYSSDSYFDTSPGFVKFKELNESYFYSVGSTPLLVEISVPADADISCLTPTKFTTFRAEGIPSVFYDTGETFEDAGMRGRIEPLHDGVADYSQLQHWRFYDTESDRYWDVPVIAIPDTSDQTTTVDMLEAYRQRAEKLISTMQELDQIFDTLLASQDKDSVKVGAYHPSTLNFVSRLAYNLQIKFDFTTAYYDNHDYWVEGEGWESATVDDLITFWTTYEVQRDHDITYQSGDTLTQTQVAELDLWLDKVVPYWLDRLEEYRISEPVITSFSVGTSYGIIDEAKHTITIRRPANENWSSEEPLIATAGNAHVKLTNGLLSNNKAVYEVTPCDWATGTFYGDQVTSLTNYDFGVDLSAGWMVNIEDGNPFNFARSFAIETSDGKTRYAAITEGEDGANGKIILNLPTGTVSSMTNLTPIVEVAGEGYYFSVDGTNVESGDGIDFTKSVTLTIYNTTYDLITSYDVSVTNEKSTECDVLSYELDGATGVVDSVGGKVTITIPYATDLTVVAPKIELSEGATITPPESLQVGTNQYTVTAQDGKTQKTYIVTISRTQASTERNIISLKYGSYAATIDHTAGKISLTVPQGVSLTFAPQIQVSNFATIEPASGVARDFSQVQTYEVTAQNGYTKVYTMTVTVSGEQAENPYANNMQALVNKIIARYRTEADNDWEWMNLGLYDSVVLTKETIPDGFDINKKVAALSNIKMTDFARGLMMLTAMGIDGTRLNDYTDEPVMNNDVDMSNLVAGLYNFSVEDTINGPAFALLAFDMGNYSIPANAKWTRAALLEKLLTHEYLSDGFGIDMVGAIMYAIAPYQDDPIYGERVKSKLDEGLAIIINTMNDDFTFGAWGAINSESACWVMMALCSMGIDCDVDPRFSDGQGNSLLSVWLNMFANYDDGYFHHSSTLLNNAMATYEGCYNSMWYLNFLKGGGQGNPCYYWYQRFDFSTPLSTDADIISFELEGKPGDKTEDGEGGTNTITVTLPAGTPLSGLTPKLTLSDGAKLVAPSLPVTFTANVAQPFTVTAEDGQTTKTYYVTVTLDGDVLASGTELYTKTIRLQDANLRDLTIANIQVNETDNGTDILLTVDAGVDVTKLRLNADISYGAAAAPALDGKTTLDLSDWISFTVTAQDSTAEKPNQQIYRIKAQAKGQAAISAFSLTIGGTKYDGVIDNTANTITVSGVDDASLTTTKFAPDITLADGTTVCNPLSGVEQDFSAPVTYTVSGSDVVSRTYTVRVTNRSGELISSSGTNNSGTGTGTGTTTSTAQITAFGVMGVDGEIDQTLGTITVRLPYGTDVSAVTPTITASSGAVINPVSGEAVNLSRAVTYVVTHGTQVKFYTVYVVFERSTAQQLWDELEDEVDITDHQISKDPYGLPGGWRP